MGLPSSSSLFIYPGNRRGNYSQNLTSNGDFVLVAHLVTLPYIQRKISAALAFWPGLRLPCPAPSLPATGRTGGEGTAHFYYVLTTRTLSLAG